MPLDEQISDVQRRLLVLDHEQRELTALLGQLNRQKQTLEPQHQNPSISIDPVTSERIRLFINLFRGREDVFPKRWENSKTGKSGYSPACQNEWVKEVCDKPRVSCSSCMKQAFAPVTEEVIRKHLCGDGFTSRLYLSRNVGIWLLQTCCSSWIVFDQCAATIE